jgi:hypothetical protein
MAKKKKKKGKKKKVMKRLFIKVVNHLNLKGENGKKKKKKGKKKKVKMAKHRECSSKYNMKLNYFIILTLHP